MGAYTLTLHAGRDVDLKLCYNRGCHCLVPSSPDVCGEWYITIKGGTVDTKFESEKFHVPYMTHMLRLLKKRVPSLHGYVSCDLDVFWIITDSVRLYDRIDIHEYACNKYEATAFSQSLVDEDIKKRYLSELQVDVETVRIEGAKTTTRARRQE